MLELLGQFQRGLIARGKGWQWWAKGDKRIARLAHQYPPSFLTVPDTRARCGFDVATDPKADGWDWYQPSDENRKPCVKCEALAGGKLLATGVIGGIDLETGLPAEAT